MEYIYAALMLHKAGKDINEENVKKVLDAAGVKADDGRIKALIAALDGVNIEEAIATAAVSAAPAAPATEAAPEEKKEEKKKEDDKKSEEQAAAGLGSLFG